MAKSDLREWAVKGAEQRLVELAEEARAIFAAFPKMRGGRTWVRDESKAESSNRQDYVRQTSSQKDVGRRST